MDFGLPLRSSPKPIALPEHRSCPVNCRRWARVNFRRWAKASCQNQLRHVAATCWGTKRYLQMNRLAEVLAIA
jgi:hypothetical protein